MATLSNLTVNELKKICKQKNVSCSGSKIFLIEKLRNPEKFKKGALCSKSGNAYEKTIFDVTSKVQHVFSKIPFNTQNESQLGGSHHNNDIECNLTSIQDIPIEIKKCSTPDWMQTKIYYNTTDKSWKVTKNGKIPVACKTLFGSLMELNNHSIFNGNIPNLKNITYEDWLIEKHKFKDIYFDCPENTIAELYREKGCFYIQISDKGLFHLGSDPCNFNVPYFSCPQKLRIRIKVHSRKNSKGYASLSPMLSCLPKDIKKIDASPYSLDDIKKIPSQLIQIS